jgi:hypothetical protein
VGWLGIHPTGLNFRSLSRDFPSEERLESHYNEINRSLLTKVSLLSAFT